MVEIGIWGFQSKEDLKEVRQRSKADTLSLPMEAFVIHKMQCEGLRDPAERG